MNVYDPDLIRGNSPVGSGSRLDYGLDFSRERTIIPASAVVGEVHQYRPNPSVSPRRAL
jgi:hypothetical protein